MTPHQNDFKWLKFVNVVQGIHLIREPSANTCLSHYSFAIVMTFHINFHI